VNIKSGKAGFVLTVMMALTATASIASGQDRDKGWFNDRDKTLVGAWRTVATIRNCQTDAPMGTVKGLFTFNAGGTLVAYGIGPGQTPALVSPELGVWKREHGWQAYSFTFMIYRYDVTGAMIGSQKVKATVQLSPNGDEFATNSSIQNFDANDNLISTGCGNLAGTRFD
jgi:hypothetical protein